MTIIRAQPLKQFGISGPASALDNEVPIFDGITGKKIKAATGIICPSSGRLDLAEIRAKDGNGLKLYEDGGAGIFVKDGGNIGIGTTFPLTKLSIQGTAGTDLMNVALPTTGASALYVAEDGNVGIGTDSPQGIFHVSSGVDVGTDWKGAYDKFMFTGQDFQFSIVDTDNGTWGAQIALKQVDGTVYENAWGMARQTNGDGPGDGSMRFTYGTSVNVYLNPEMVTFATSGNVGIGTTAPSAKLDVNSDVIRLRTAKTPASAGAAGNQGDECWNADYHYRCVATNTWKRTALTTW